MYIHKLLFTVVTILFVYIRLGCGVGGSIFYVIVVGYFICVGCVFCGVVVCGLGVFICFIIVCGSCFILMFCTVVATYYFSCASVVIALPG
jgi:hypothetical protein